MGFRKLNCLLVLSRLATILALGCAIASLFLPWYHVSYQVQPRALVVIKTHQQLSAPSMCLFYAPVVVSLASWLLFCGCSSFAWLGGAFSLVAGCAGVPLMWVYVKRVALWTLAEPEAAFGAKSTGWWLCLGSSILVALAGVLALASRFRKIPQEPLLPSKAIRVSDSGSRDQDAAKKAQNWVEMNSNPLYLSPSQPSTPGASTGLDYIAAVRPPSPDRPTVASPKTRGLAQWVSQTDSVSLREAYRSRKYSPLKNETAA